VTRYALTLRLPEQDEHRVYTISACVRDLLEYAVEQDGPLLAWDTLAVQIVTTPDELAALVRARIDTVGDEP
jgi:hypothetical protein